ncbi:14708_t:CDS:2, partial [Acaulospora morrowiae]
VLATDYSIKAIRLNRERYSDFLTDEHTLPKFQSFKVTLDKIIEFVSNVSQTAGLANYKSHEEIEQKFFQLIDELDESSKRLYFSPNPYRRNYNNFLKRDFHEYEKFLEYNPRVVEQSKKIMNLIEEAKKPRTAPPRNMPKRVDIKDYKTIYEKPGTRIQKRVSRYNNNHVFAFKKIPANMSNDAKENLFERIAILQEFKNSTYIITFYGVAESDREIYIVIEWAKYGNLKEYYEVFGPLECSRKIQFSLDICRGLNFLHASGILHHDINSENILVTDNHKAKIANFDWSKESEKSTLKRNLPTDNLRYMAPEKIMIKNLKYDTKCEIYSFGMLLWEIAEERVPYSDVTDYKKICKLITENEREEFSNNNLPDRWKSLFRESSHIANLRNDQTFQQFAKSYGTCMSKNKSQRIGSFDSILPIDTFDGSVGFDDSIFKTVIKLDEAIEESRKEDGDIGRAWECFNVYAKFGVPIAKFWMGYLLYYNKIFFHNDVEREENKIQEAIKYFKESADEEVADAQLYYADCLVNGNGVKKDIRKATEYYKKSADNGNICGMYSYGNIIYNGFGGTKNIEEGLKYLRMAAEKGHKRAMKCVERW